MSIALPPTTISELEACGRDGQALAAALHDIDQLHLPLVFGLFSVFTELVRIGWFQDFEVIFPPHSTTTLDTSKWISGGLSRSVIDLLPFLPHRKIDHTFPSQARLNLAPGGSSIDYTNPFPSVRNPFHDSAYDSYLPPHILRLAAGNWGGFEILYDALTGQVAQFYFSQYDPSIPFGIFAASLSWTVGEVYFRTWLENLHALKWLPDPTSNDLPEGGFDEEISPVPQAIDQYRHPARSRRNRVHVFRAKQRIFRKHGWPGSGYIAEPCMEQLRRFNKREAELFAKVMNHRGVMDFEKYYPEVQEAPLREYESFLEGAVSGDRVTEEQTPLAADMIGVMDEISQRLFSENIDHSAGRDEL
ncbi:Hypothetical protein D9617_1g088390 [Elsinoe fawcettii]|nr:Hypothetical protein D9617_1g088390 [Elsinoe fawcettii]